METPAEANASKSKSEVNWWMLAILVSGQILSVILDNWMPKYLASGSSLFVASLMIYGFKSARRRYSFVKFVVIVLLCSLLYTVAVFCLALIFNKIGWHI